MSGALDEDALDEDALEEEALGEAGGGEFCPACGKPVAEDQEWCLECGAARTIIRRAPDPRVGLAIVVAVVALVTVVLVIVFS